MGTSAGEDSGTHPGCQLTWAQGRRQSRAKRGREQNEVGCSQEALCRAPGVCPLASGRR